MSQELLFTSGYININGSNDIKGKTFSCHYVPDGIDLKMRINNLTLSENSLAKGPWRPPGLLVSTIFSIELNGLPHPKFIGEQL